MAKKFSASIVDSKGLFTKVYVEANNLIEAKRALQAQYSGYRITFLKEETSSGSSSTGCALAFVTLVGLFGYGAWHVVDAVKAIVH